MMGRRKKIVEVIENPVVETVLPPSSVDVALEPSDYELPLKADRVNNIIHKERAMYEAGVTRRRTYEVICELLTAVKRVVGYDSRGMEVVTEEPDLDKRKMGAELALKAFGDLKEMKDVGGQTTYNTVVYQWKK